MCVCVCVCWRTCMFVYVCIYRAADLCRRLNFILKPTEYNLSAFSFG